jgi:phenylpropionate dioxygenase-like ring-hydroxylating dioxygenase large terminal subunit
MSLQTSIPMLSTEEAAKLLGRGPLDSRPYWDPDWYELERKAIFMRTWLHIGHVCELPEPGNFIVRAVEFAKASLLITRGKDGAVRAFHNVCTHRGTQLVPEETEGKRNQFSCPYHRWTFGSDGKLLSAPDFERFHLKKEDCSLKAVQCGVLAGMIFINLDPAPKQSLEAFFGAIGDEMATLPVARATHFTEYIYEIDANWKTNFDNFQENYHLRFVHPRHVAGMLNEDSPFGYPIAYGFSGDHRSQALPKTRNPDYVVPPTMMLGTMRGAAVAQAEGLAFAKTDFKLFPCLHVVGLAPNLHTHTMWPLGPKKTRGQIRLYWVGEADSASKLFHREFSQMMLRDVLAEDRPAITSGQRGLDSGALAQVHFQDHEMLPRHLYELVTAKVAAYRTEMAAG